MSSGGAPGSALALEGGAAGPASDAEADAGGAADGPVRARWVGRMGEVKTTPLCAGFEVPGKTPSPRST
jgi:hypothetical protein